VFVKVERRFYALIYDSTLSIEFASAVLPWASLALMLKTYIPADTVPWTISLSPFKAIPGGNPVT